MLTPKQAKEEYLKRKLEREEERKKKLPRLMEEYLNELILNGKTSTSRSYVVDEFRKHGFKVKTIRNWYFKKTGYTITID